jgi:hypothetical protein
LRLVHDDYGCVRENWRSSLILGHLAFMPTDSDGSAALDRALQEARAPQICDGPSTRAAGGEKCFAPFLTLTALSVVPENKLRLRDDRDELAIRRCDACLPHHRSPAAMQRRRSPTIRLPMGAVLMKLVLLSIVAVRPPSVRFASVPSAPNVSAKAMTAPPCSTAGRVQSSSRTVISATILSVTALTISMPRSAANGSGSFVRCVSKSIPGLPRMLAARPTTPAPFAAVHESVPGMIHERVGKRSATALPTDPLSHRQDAPAISNRTAPATQSASTASVVSGSIRPE